MKKRFGIFVLLILTTAAYSQEYFPLIQEQNKWNVLTVFGSVLDSTYTTITYKLSGDTTLSSTTYKKLYSSPEENPENWEIWGFMREDTDKKVWLRLKTNAEEFLMYDFSIAEGDSVLVGISEPVYLHLDSINYISVNQIQRKQYWLSCNTYPNYNEKWIEGIGSNKGINWSGSTLVVGSWFRLLCMSENETLIYSDPGYESCYLVTEINEIEDETVVISPNPVKNMLQIKNLGNSEITSISLLNTKGQKVKDFAPNGVQFDISEMKDGLYLLQIVNNKGKIVVKKLLKE